MGDVFSDIENPLASGYGGIENQGLITFLSNVIRLVTIAGGIFMLINIVVAGLTYISSGDNPEATSKAWQRIYVSLIGMVVIVGAYAIAAVIGLLLFGEPGAILNPTITGPGSAI